jgi:hypothetical protein
MATNRSCPRALLHRDVSAGRCEDLGLNHTPSQHQTSFIYTRYTPRQREAGQQHLTLLSKRCFCLQPAPCEECQGRISLTSAS